MYILHLTLNPDVFIAVMMHGVVDLLLLIVFGVRSWETGINILRNNTKLLAPASSQARKVCLFQRSVLVECATNKICAVRQIWCVRFNFDTSSPGSSNT
jgi:hypothetical protein